MNHIQISLPTGRVSNIYIGSGIANLGEFIKPSGSVIITEQKIYDLYKQQFPALTSVITILGGEQNKTLATVERIAEQLLELGADRHTVLIGIGGGIVTDITGFVASIYMRGLKFGFVSTTLLSQVDASVGGKNGVNFLRYKNMLGVFNQPDFVLCDTTSLQTLDAREVSAGLAEVVKTALLADRELFEYLEMYADEILGLQSEYINHIVSRCVEIKASIVARDERETGERRKLNLGHTFAHSVEKYGTDVLHGEAVAIGLTIAGRLSVGLGLLSTSELDRIVRLLEKFNLPTTTAIDPTLLLEGVTKDKKKDGDSIHFIFNRGIGDSEVRNVTFAELSKLYQQP